ncbi:MULTISPECIES: DUF5065 family protein [Bacillus cereus group]|uniref:DUF5065 family protein n=1 Tax=Bacillus cereus group TaxID=86661 RepID=UPI0008646583|nr:DUF5065 family protein [Bacillus mycoides]MBJ8073635.1 DUF5065 family protein [Bacillus cereus]MBJ8190454.1 DUF5065 family protein [Bacillus cereus]OHX28443.1 hypothetical protein BWGOE5_56630 [Bacillus mycoides]QWH15414.1 DUF5065 family protein [Bacillus mycoides]TBX71386.1 DUF5065 family protein [Bacillus mycoides]
MKLLGKVAIIGALTIGGSVFPYTIGKITPASAESQFIQKASPFFDDWQWQNYFSLHHNADFLQELAVGDLKHGDTFDITIYTGGKDTGIVKIYRLNEDENEVVNMQRYKTIYDTGTEHNYGRFVTPITSVYKPGSYVAVMKLGENYYYGGSFKITK